MKYKLNITKIELLHWVYFSLGMLILLEVLFYKSGIMRIIFISLKLSLLHLSGYLISLRLFREDFDHIALLFMGFAFSLIIASVGYYLPSLLGVNVNRITYLVPIILLILGIAINVSKNNEKNKEEIKIEEENKTTEPTQNP